MVEVPNLEKQRTLPEGVFSRLEKLACTSTVLRLGFAVFNSDVIPFEGRVKEITRLKSPYGKFDYLVLGRSTGNYGGSYTHGLPIEGIQRIEIKGESEPIYEKKILLK